MPDRHAAARARETFVTRAGRETDVDNALCALRGCRRIDYELAVATILWRRASWPAFERTVVAESGRRASPAPLGGAGRICAGSPCGSTTASCASSKRPSPAARRIGPSTRWPAAPRWRCGPGLDASSVWPGFPASTRALDTLAPD